MRDQGRACGGRQGKGSRGMKALAVEKKGKTSGCECGRHMASSWPSCLCVCVCVCVCVRTLRLRPAMLYAAAPTTSPLRSAASCAAMMASGAARGCGFVARGPCPSHDASRLTRSTSHRLLGTANNT
eukprot:366113-Chlamydomonas_euryale.AAC.19